MSGQSTVIRKTSMQGNKSQRIVNFIGGLTPAYDRYLHGKKHAAISLEHGHIYVAPDDPDACEEGIVRVYWQSDSARQSEIVGSRLVALAIARYAQLQMVPHSEETQFEFREMANHFEVKTGCTIGCGMEASDDEPLSVLVTRAASKLGKEAVIALIKAKLGL